MRNILKLILITLLSSRLFCDIKIEHMTPLELDPEILKGNMDLDNHIELLTEPNEIFDENRLLYEISMPSKEI